MGLEQFNVKNVELIQKKIKEALLSLSMAYGFDIDISDVNYSDVFMTGKFSFKLNNDDARKRIREGKLVRIKQMLSYWGFPEDWANKKFNIMGVDWIIEDVDSTPSGLPFIMTDGRGTYKVSVEDLKKLDRKSVV